MAQELVTFDGDSANRMLKATRAVESMGLTPQSRRRPSFSIVQVVRITAGPDGEGFYDGVLQVMDPDSYEFEDFLDENGAEVEVKVKDING